jgi:hypothetical protein
MSKTKIKHSPWVRCYICGRIHKDYYNGSWKFAKLDRWRVICAWHDEKDIEKFMKGQRVEKKTFQMPLEV